MITARPLAIITIAAAEPAQTVGSSSGLTTALIAAGAAIVGAAIAYVSARKTSVETRGTQKLLATMARRERQEEKRQSLQNEHVLPFFVELTRNIRLANDVNVHIVNDLQKNPLSPPFKRMLLINSGVVDAWGDSAVALSDQRAMVLLALNTPKTINEFSVGLNELAQLQIETVMYLLNEFDFSEKRFDALKAFFSKNQQKSTELFISTRNAILFAAADDVEVEWTFSTEGLRDKLFERVPAKLKYQYAKGATSWSVCWSMPLPSNQEAKTDFASFCSERDNFYAALARVEGVLATEAESEENNEKHYSRVTVRFASEANLKKFVKLLPQLKVQSKTLWLEPVSPQELIGS